jgi:type IV secretory pathway TrbD component
MEFLLWVRDRFERVAPLLGRMLPPVGVLMLVMAAGFGVHSWMFARERVRTVATITENVSWFAKEGGVVYVPRFRFRAKSGELVTVMARSGGQDIEFAAGETVPVLYRAGDPQSAEIATGWRAYHAAIVLGLWGVALFDLGWAVRVMMRRRAPN